MTGGPLDAHADSGLNRGVTAVAFALHTTRNSAYTEPLATLDRHIGDVARRRLRAAHARIDDGDLPHLREFDLISGLTGIGAYLLHRHGRGGLLREVLTYLVRLTDPIAHDGDTLPGWWCAGPPNPRTTAPWPGGHGNLGLAHGIAGPLALLSSAARRGTVVSGQEQAINRICAWLDEWRAGEGARAWWPETVSRAEHHARAVRQPGPGRPSWCYGTPGLARAQQLAGIALGDVRRQKQAEQALTGCVTDRQQLTKLGDTSLCHGWSGTLHTTWRAATDPAARTDLTPCLPPLRTGLDQTLTRDGRPESDGLLEGRAGVRLAQHTSSTGKTVSGWDACLLLDG